MKLSETDHTEPKSLAAAPDSRKELAQSVSADPDPKCWECGKPGEYYDDVCYECAAQPFGLLWQLEQEEGR
jgi:hypothetical protein